MELTEVESLRLPSAEIGGQPDTSQMLQKCPDFRKFVLASNLLRDTLMYTKVPGTTVFQGF
jgi:hypothetical protein